MTYTYAQNIGSDGSLFYPMPNGVPQGYRVIWVDEDTQRITYAYARIGVGDDREKPAMIGRTVKKDGYAVQLMEPWTA